MKKRKPLTKKGVADITSHVWRPTDSRSQQLLLNLPKLDYRGIPCYKSIQYWLYLNYQMISIVLYELKETIDSQ